MADEHDPGNLAPPRLLGGRRRPGRTKAPKAPKPPKTPKPAKATRAPSAPSADEPAAVSAAPTDPDVATAPEAVDDTRTVPVWDPEPTATLAPVEPVAAPETEDSEPAAAGAESSATRTRGRRTLPRPGGLPRPAGLRRPSHVDGRVAAVVAGLVAGFVLVGGVVLGLQGCQAVQGTDSCGTGPGLGLLVVIFVVAVVVGRFLLALFAQPDPGSTSFLSVGLTSVLALLFLTSVIDSWPMIIVIPVLTAVTMLGSWLVTTRFFGSAST